jgi:hypothetical protein
MDRAEKVLRINRATQDPKARQSLMEMIEEAPVAPKVEAPKKKVVKKKAKKKVLAPRSR